VTDQPWAVLGSDGQHHLVYELRIENVTDRAATVRSITVLDAQSDDVLAVLDAREVGRRLSLGGRRGSESKRLRPSQFAVVFLHVAIEADAPPPSTIVHETVARIKGFPEEAVVRSQPVDVVTLPPPVLGAPLKGANYVAADGCCDSIRHVRALLPINGAHHLAQRFAVDWEQLDASNRVFAGDRADPRSYPIYGEEVLAVADGTVVDSRNDLPDQVPGALPEGLPIDEADGNFVVQEIAGGVFVLYAHMQPGTVTVGPGDEVRKGDVIGIVGNSGNSSAPHLHLHVMDGPSPLVSNGLPYVFETYSITGVDELGTADFDRAEATGRPMTVTPVAPPEPHVLDLPLDLTVVDWGNADQDCSARDAAASAECSSSNPAAERLE
jgi:hypothetical protein